MEIMEAFSAWMLAPPRLYGDETVALYLQHVKQAREHPKGILARLGDRNLAPKTRWSIRAALRAYAKFTKDAELSQTLSEVALPRPVRKTVRMPLETKDWHKLVAEIEKTEDVSEPVRAVLGIMATRGLRVGDVLRLRRTEVVEFMETDVLGFEAKGELRVEYRMPMSRPYLQILADMKGWKQVVDLIAVKQAGKFPTRAAKRRIQRRLRQVAEACGLPPEAIYPHRLRRTYVVHFLRALKGDPEAMPKLMRHMQWADLDTTHGYVDYVRSEDLEDIQEEILGGAKYR